MQGDTGVGEFLKSINLRAQKNLERLEKETDEYISAKMSSAKDNIRRDIDEVNNRKKALVKNDTGRELSRRQNEAKAELFEFRRSLAASVFDDAKKKIAEYSHTDEYKNALITLAQKAVSTVGEDANLFIRSEDSTIFSEFIKEHPSVKIKIDETNKLGGLRAVSSDNTLAADCTYESRLEKSGNEFQSSGKLTIE